MNSEQLEDVALEDLVRLKVESFLQKCGTCELEDLHHTVIKQVEKPLIELVLKRSRGNQIKASKMLGLNRNTLRKKMNTYQILAKDNKEA